MRALNEEGKNYQIGLGTPESVPNSPLIPMVDVPVDAQDLYCLPRPDRVGMLVSCVLNTHHQFAILESSLVEKV